MRRTMPSQPAPSPPWSPYGLEAHRVALLRRRQRMLQAGIVLGLLVVLGILANSIRTEDQVTDLTGAERVRVPVNEQPRAKPTTLSVSPGRTTVMEQPIQEEKAPRSQGGEAPPGTPEGLNWMALVMNAGPPIAAAAYAWRVGKRRIAGPLEQVNLGVYKGAMPLELLTAEHRKYVFTREQARTSLFGKRAEDHVPRQPVVLQRRPAVLRRP